MNDLGSLLWEYNASDPVGKTNAFLKIVYAFIDADRLDLAIEVIKVRELRELNRAIKKIVKEEITVR